MRRAIDGLAVSVFTLVVASSLSAHAQCAPGLVATEQSDGYCCWPGQRWSAERSRCEGPPRCPPPMLAEGDHCVGEPPPALSEPAPPELSEPTPSEPTPSEPAPDTPHANGSILVPPEPPPPEGVAAMWGAEGEDAIGPFWPTSEVRPPGAPPPRFEVGVDGGLLALGVTLWAVGYGGGGVVPAAFAFGHGGLDTPRGRDATCHDIYASVALIPVIGGLLATIPFATCSVEDELYWYEDRTLERHTEYLVLSLAGAAVQIAGFAITLWAALTEVDHVEFPEGFAILPSFGPDGGTLALRLTLD